jgi:hypothetical protein
MPSVDLYYFGYLLIISIIVVVECGGMEWKALRRQHAASFDSCATRIP